MVETDIGNGKLLALIAAKGELISTQYDNDRMHIHCRLPQKYIGKIELEHENTRVHTKLEDQELLPESPGESIQIQQLEYPTAKDESAVASDSESVAQTRPLDDAG